MAQRFVVIRCLRAQCESGQLLVDLFVNYDCDLEGQNLFERMVLALVRLAQGNVLQDATAQAIAEEQAMRLAVCAAANCHVNKCAISHITLRPCILCLAVIVWSAYASVTHGLCKHHHYL